MIRLIALNENVKQPEDRQENTSFQDDHLRWKSPCETLIHFGNRDLEKIAEAEYLRALRLIFKGEEEYALSILNGLLECKVLNEVSSLNFNSKLLDIRYNCYKNAAYIYEKKVELKNALKYFIYAIQFDDKDVHAMVRLGELALKGSFCEMAEFVFNECLKQNQNHWMAVDNILQLLRHDHNILGAYSWALQILSKDPYYRLANNVISEVNYLFSDDTFFSKNVWIEYPIFDNTIKFDQDNFKSVEWNSLRSDLSEKEILNISFSNWLSIENILATKKCYELVESSTFLTLENNYPQTSDVDNLKKFKANNFSPLYTKNICKEHYFSSQDLIQSHEIRNDDFHNEEGQKPILEVNNLEIPFFLNKNSKTQQQNIQSEEPIGLPLNNLKSDGNDTCKSKCKRRCSDLHFLEQWSWHKNRRYSSRRKIQVRSKTDTTLKENLERIFTKYLKTPLEISWSLDCKKDLKFDEIEKSICSKCCHSTKSLEDFFADTQNEFNIFKESLNEKKIDIILLVFTWLKYISTFWNTLIPKEVLGTYYETCEFYMNHIDTTIWNQSFEEDFKALYQILLLFLEIEFQIKEHESSEISKRWKIIYNCLMCYSGTDVIVVDTNFDSNMLRLLNLAYKFTKYENNLKKSEIYLTKLQSCLDFACTSNDFTFHLPNMEHSCLNKKNISRQKYEIKRKLSLMAIPELFEAKKWSQLVEIISSNLMHIKLSNDCQYWKQDLNTQFKIIIEALWSLNDYESCLKWAEQFFHISVTNCLNEAEHSDQLFWIQSINFAIAYMECAVITKSYLILDCLESCISRLVKNIIKISSAQFDAPLDTQKALYAMDIKKTWVILHQITLRDEQTSTSLERKVLDPVIDIEEIEDILPNSFLILFTAHEFLGKRKWCTRGNGEFLQYILDVLTPTLRAPSHDAYRDVAYEYLEQVTYCLYGFPTKKTRLRHLEDHESQSVELSLSTAIQLFDIYRPESVPEFNSYKLESISSDMEQLLLKTVTFLLTEINTVPATTKIMQYINGDSEETLEEFDCIKLSYKISSIFYLLADYYFKNRDFSKTINYYTLDLAHNPLHLDSWAGLALSKASKIESQLNDFMPIEITTFLSECESIIRCFEQCRILNPTHTLLWIEYGSFSYTIYSFCSRHLKQHSPTMSIAEFNDIEKQKEKMLNIAYNCFSSANSLQNKFMSHEKSNEETHDEKWLCRYMLGKITEKRKEQPRVYLNHYLKAAHYLYESNATYPIKINHSSPTPLSVEALEVFYRTNSAILKFLESEAEINRETGDLLVNVLKNLSSSPFAFNKAKIDGNSLNALKRSMKNKECEKLSLKKTKLDDKSYEAETEYWNKNYKETQQKEKNVFQGQSVKEIFTLGILLPQSTKSSSSDSFTDSDSDAKHDNKKNAFYSKDELALVYNELVNNLEECITRFPEHFKSIYRLAFHFMNSPGNLQNLDRCENLLLGQYTTRLGNQISGIFADRRSNNIFNGIWRLPSSEIDRPGSFSTHMVKCVSILIQMLAKQNNHKLLIEVGLQLYKTPENDKRYIKDSERIELYHQSIFFCVQIVREILKKNTISRNNNEIINVLIDIYRAYKKYTKCTNEKESPFTQLLVEIYKFYIHSKVTDIPENCNIIDIVIKFCTQEINLRKNQIKNNEDRKSCKAQNIALGINKSSTCLEKDLSQKGKLDEPSLDYVELNSGKQSSSENENAVSCDKYPALSSKNSHSQFISSSIVNASSSTILPSDIGYPSLAAECYKMLDIDNKEANSLKKNSSKTIYNQSSQNLIPGYFSSFSDYKFEYNSELKLCENEILQAKKKLSETAQIVCSNNNAEKEKIFHRKILKDDELMSSSEISSRLFTLHNDEKILNSSDILQYPQFKKINAAESCVTLSKYSDINKLFPTTDIKLSSILDPQGNNRALENKLKCKAKMFSTKSKNNSKPYKREMRSPSHFPNNESQRNSTYSMKNMSSLYYYTPTEYVSKFDSQENSRLESIPTLFQNFPNDQMFQQSLATYNISTSHESKVTTSIHSSPDINTVDSHNASATTSLGNKTSLKTNEGILKLNTTSSLQQLLVSRENNSDSRHTGEMSVDRTSTGGIIILD